MQRLNKRQEEEKEESKTEGKERKDTGRFVKVDGRDQKMKELAAPQVRL